MKTTKSIHNRFVRWVFGIQGPLDEHARQELGRISTNIAAILIVVQLIGLGVAVWISERFSATTAFNALFSLVLVSLLGLTLYGNWTLSRAQLTQRETSTANYAVFRRQQIRHTFLQTVICTAGLYLLNWLWDGNAAFADFFSARQLVRLLILIVGFFAIFYVNNVRSIRRYEE